SKIYHFSINFETTKPRLDNARSIPKLISKVEIDQLLSTSINKVVYYLITSLFYFKLDLVLERYNRKYIITGYILYLIRCNNPAFEGLFSKLLRGSIRF
ncbi:hypothetical protein CC78DRAFT_466424, partial [Lojkania enalia]